MKSVYMTLQFVPTLLVASMLPFLANAQQVPGITTTIENDAVTTEENPLATREQRLAVPPLDWNATRGEGLRTHAVQEAERIAPSQEPSGMTASGAPNPGADAEAEQLHQEEWEGLRKLNQTQQ